jgi:hypothetical protein
MAPEIGWLPPVHGRLDDIRCQRHQPQHCVELVDGCVDGIAIAPQGTEVVDLSFGAQAACTLLVGGHNQVRNGYVLYWPTRNAQNGFMARASEGFSDVAVTGGRLRCVEV